MTGTTVPAALQALNSLVAAALPDWDVVDGPIYDLPDQDFVCIGFTGNENEPAVAVAVSPASAGMASNREIFDVQCQLTYHTGTDDLAAARVAAYVALEAIENAIATDRTLDGAVSLAQVSGHQLMQEKAETGTSATVAFTVNCDAWK